VVLRNLFVSKRRKESRAPRCCPGGLPGPNHGPTTPAPAEGQTEWIVYIGELRHAIDDVCLRLLATGYAPDKMKVFRLRHIWGMKLADIAWNMGRSVTWVHNVVHSAELTFKMEFRKKYPGILQDFSAGKPTF
jgi:DNA-directed RNA polymerase specialized sigma24 family protein